jgi:polysaccharide export outer membrane protein
MFTRRFLSRPMTRGAFLLLAVLGGCGPVLKQGTPLATVIEEDRQTANGAYRLQPGDQLEVHHPLDPDYSTLITVPPDGKLSLPGIVGQVEVQGSTVPELTDKLKALYRQADVLHKPFFSINLRSFGNLQVFVGGEVQRPGFLELAGGDRHVLQVIMSGGGFLSTARRNEVIIVRTGPDGQSKSFSVNLEDVIRGTDLSQNVRVRPMDVVLVPRSDIASLDVWVEQYIRQALPLPTSATITNQPAFLK